MPRVLDIGAQIAHGPLRAYVMGERGAANEPATDDDIAAMAALVEEALRAGALGFSTSRTPLHRARTASSCPAPPPTSDELLGIGRAIRRVGHGVFQFAPDHAPRAGRRVAVDARARRAHRTAGERQPQPARQRARRVARGAAACSTRRTPTGCRSSPRWPAASIGILYCLQGSVHPLLFHPAYQEVAAPADAPNGSLALAEPERRRRIIEDVPDDGGLLPQAAVLDKLDRMWLVDDGDIDYEPPPTSVGRRRARAHGRAADAARPRPAHVADGNGMIYAPFFNYSYGDLSMTYEAHPPRAHADRASATPARTAARSATAARRRSCSPTGPATAPADRELPLEYVVHRQTAQTAALYGLGDRGVVAPGMRADLNLIDYDRARLRSAAHGATTCRPAAAGWCRRPAATRARVRAPACRPSPTTSSREPTPTTPTTTGAVAASTRAALRRASDWPFGRGMITWPVHRA